MAKLWDITNDEWASLASRLTEYAAAKMRVLSWRGGPRGHGATGPGGVGPEDIVNTAVERVFDGSRAWDEAADPAVTLRGVVDSLVSHLVNGSENRLSRPMPTVAGDDGVERVIDPAGRDAGPLEALAEDEQVAGRREAIREAVAGDPLAGQLFDCLAAGFETPADVAAVLGVPVEQIYTAKRRLERAVNRVLDNTYRRHKGPPNARCT